MHAALLCACLAAGRAAARAAGGAQAEMFPQTCATGNCNKAMGSSSLLQRRAVDSMAEYYESDLEGEEGEEYDEVVVTKATSEGSANKATNKEHQVSAGSNGKKKAASNEKKSRNSRTKGSIATNTSKDDASSRRNWQRVAASHSSLVSVDGHHVWLITRDQKNLVPRRNFFCTLATSTRPSASGRCQRRRLFCMGFEQCGLHLLFHWCPRGMEAYSWTASTNFSGTERSCVGCEQCRPNLLPQWGAWPVGEYTWKNVMCGRQWRSRRSCLGPEQTWPHL